MYIYIYIYIHEYMNTYIFTCIHVHKSGNIYLPLYLSIRFQDLTTSEVSTDTFDAVLVCTGHHADKNMPTFPGLDDFQGKVVHPHDYKVGLSLSSTLKVYYFYLTLQIFQRTFFNVIH